MKKNTIAMLGAGSWGTAVAIHLAQCGHEVRLWGHKAEHVQSMINQGENQAYLPGVPFPKLLKPEANLDNCLKAETIIIAVPSHAFASVLSSIQKAPAGLAWLTKGIDPISHELLSSLVSKQFGPSFPVAVISGPSFAKEVAKALPTAITLAGNNSAYQKTIHGLLHRGNMRVYLSDDLIGVQLCGAVKNVLAIACGISDGLGYGANAKAALITRGLAEMSRLGVALGAKPETFLGLAGVGDLVLTCTDNQSRNRRFGLLLGQNTSISEAEQSIGQVVEGKYNASQVCTLAAQHKIDMPICQQINALLQEETLPEQAVDYLMNRPAKEE